MNVVIFDMDGTLINSEKAIEVTINEMRAKLGLEPNLDSKYIVETINNPQKNYIKEFYGISSVTSEQRAEFEKSFRKNYKLHAKVYDGVLELLQRCKNSDYFIALATNAPDDSIRNVLKKTEIFHYFDMIIGASDKIPSKPDPTMLLEVVKSAKKNGDDVKACFVGDSIRDEEAAVNANMPYIQVCWGFGKESSKFDNINEISNLMDRISAIFYKK